MNYDELAGDDKSEHVFAILRDEYASFRETSELRKKYIFRSYMLVTTITILSLLPGIFADTLWLAIPFTLIWFVFLAVFIREFPKICKYKISDEKNIFVSLCRAYEEIRLFNQKGSISYLKEARRALKKAASMISSSIHSSPWKPVNEFNEQLQILSETIEKRIIWNLKEKVPSDNMLAINYEVAQLANLTRNMSTTMVRDYITNLNENKSIPLEPSIKLESRHGGSKTLIRFKTLIRSIPSHNRSWQLAKAIGLFGLSSSTVLTFTWLLCAWQKTNINDHIGNITTATFALWCVLYWKTKGS